MTNKRWRRLLHNSYDLARAALTATLSMLPSWKTWVTLGVLAALGIAATSYMATRHLVVLEINGRLIAYRSHQSSVEGILREVGIQLLPEDQLEAPAPRELIEGQPLQISLARSVLIIDESTVTRRLTYATSLGAVLDEASVSLGEYDRSWLGQQIATRDTTLPEAVLPKRGTISELVNAIRQPIQVQIERARTIQVFDGQNAQTLHTLAPAVGAALWQAGIIVYEGDHVEPALAAPIAPGLAVHITRSMPIVLDVGGTGQLLRTRQETIAQLLDEQRVTLGELDYVEPGLDTPLAARLRIAVIRVLDEFLVEEMPIAYEILWEPDQGAEIDTVQIITWGQEGARRQLVHIRYENRQQTFRQVDDEWVAREPENRVIRYGTQIILRTIDTPQGAVTYWRKIRMLATSYNAPTAGKPMNHPNYGITRTGVRARKGIIAVDPRVIHLGQDLYVPGYGKGLAGDTGGAIKWRRVDLCYDDDDLVLWHKWVDVYLLAPAPDPAEINWNIPNSPVERE